ncbi:MAG: hypothetical protein A6D92_04130 [Symbiobacterium thermophilum]|uniref:Uncharacterized protein n=1 Tax=Symbiobacterium thermophilum TaxID=2734 RepID=A0A1Y2T979_SYMTR|nr:MAG: hypothetical protein A6D92_04130 [Symbiobacterium thermophilum]
MSPSFLQQLVDRLRQEPRVLAVYVDRGLTAPRTGEVQEITLHLAVEGSFAQAADAWAASLAELVYSGPESHGWTLITPDGTEWRLCFHGPSADFAEEGLQGVFDRRAPSRVREGAQEGASPSPGGAAGQAQTDVAAVAAAFWRDLYRAARAIRAGRALTAHHWLFACGGRMIDLYRLALQPGPSGRGWEGADEVPGMARALEPVREFLSSPLDCPAQRRAARRLGEAFEGLVLPLCRRIGATYPMALRTLTFRALEPEPDAAGGGGAAPHPSDATARGRGSGSGSGMNV